ncbi:MAG: hypothetical protein HFJ79_08050 [Clostridiales bacterium]|jgi:hypothetical protein|nr:hypothetical protein [Clostridiales bacterium]
MEIKGWVMTGAFIAALAVTTGANLLTPSRDYSETENRYLQQMPAFTSDNLFSGRFTKDFDTYASDQFWNRDGWVGMKTLSQLALLQKDNGRVYFGKDNTLFEKTTAFSPSRVDANCEAVAEFLSRVKDLSPDTRSRVMLVPTAAAIDRDKLPLLAPVADEGAVIDRMKSAAGDALIDPTGLLLQHKEEGLYYRTDHHWTTAGAYYGYTAFAGGMGFAPAPKESFQIQTVTDQFYGTLYSKANLHTIPPDRIETYTPTPAVSSAVSWQETTGQGTASALDSLYDASYLEQKDKYAYFLGGNHPLTRINTDTKNGRTLLLLKDSYANALVPFLTAHYEHLVLVDLRYYKQSIAPLFDEGIDDLLILYNVSGFAEEKTVAAGLPVALPAE